MKKGFIFLIISAFVFFSHGNDKQFWQKKVLALFPEAVKIRRDLHQIPEPCFKEKKTAAYVTKYLKDCGLEVQTGIGGCGIKAVLRGNKDHPVIALRADMDALPIQEQTGLAFQSGHPGFMHACGHDGHMTNLLIAAKILAQMKDKIPGTIVFIFQPCEEGDPTGNLSGAYRMVQAGVLANPKVDAILGLHIMPEFPVGTVALCPGPLMANVSSIYVTIKGKSSHGAFPHQGIDSIYVAALAIVQMQSIISRLKDPQDKAVLSIGTIHGGTKVNIIADSVEMSGTVRTFSLEMQDFIEKNIDQILKGLAVTYGITYDFRFSKSSSFVNNDEKITPAVTNLFKRLLGENNVIKAEPLTIGEDFAAYGQKVPAVFFFLGTGGAGKLHGTDYAIDEEIFKYGPMLFCAGAIELLDYFSKKG